MGRGLITGVLWGSVISVLSLWGLSQMGGQVHILSDHQAEVGDMAPIPGDGGVAENAGEPPVAPDAQASPSTDPSRQGTPPAAVETESAPATETAAAPVPETGDVVSEQTSPDTETAPQVIASSDNTAASDSSGAGAAPDMPVAEVSPEVVTEIPTPMVVPEGQETPDTPDVAEEPAPVTPQPDSTLAQVTEPDQPSEPQQDVVPNNDFSTPKVIDTPVPEADETVVTENSTDGGEPQGEDATGGEGSGSTGTAVVVDRTSRSLTEAPQAVEETQPAEDQETDDPDADEPVVVTGPAIEAYAQEFANPEGRPLMAIVLLVDGEQTGALSTPLPFPVSYVVDASKDNAKDVMASFRAAGSEVIALTPLPEGAAPKDVEVAFQTYLNAVPEAVAVMDVPAAVFQSGRSVATHVSEVLAASGHGMITYSRGLNSATQVAERAGVPAALVFRVFDDNDRDGAAIKRFLDQAAFRAGQQTGVILVGHNRPETLTALLEWGLGNRASTVALAPVSAALTSQ